MMGWRGRIGFMVPPGNPTVEPEMMALAPRGVSLHFHRMVVRGATGTLDGQEERNRSQIRHLDETAEILAMVKPGVMVLAHTATSYTLGRDGETELIARLSQRFGIPVITAFGSVVAAFAHLSVRRLALGAPYGEETTRQGKAHLEAHGFEVVNVARLPDVTNIYEETEERAYRLACMANGPAAGAVFLSGVGLPTIAVLATLERDLAKPVVSSAAAMMWNALRTIGVREAAPGHGSLLEGLGAPR